VIDRRDSADVPLSFSVIHAMPSRTAPPLLPRVMTLAFSWEFESRFLHCSAHQSRRTLVMHRTHSHYTVRGDFASLQDIDTRDQLTLAKRSLRRLEGFLFRAVVTASYGGAWMVEALMRGARRACTFLTDQGRQF
jgi:hypothetical protein